MNTSSPGTDVVLDGFERPRLARLRLERFTRGSDGFHIDVMFAPALIEAAQMYLRALVREQVQQLWGQPVQAFSESVVKVFRREVVDHHGAVVKQARRSNRVERVQLFELALLKLLFEQVDAQLLALRAELEDARGGAAHDADRKSFELQQRVVVLVRQSGQVRYRIARHVIRELLRIEYRRLRKVRKSAFNISWPVPELMLSNPILQLQGLGDARDFRALYPLLLHDAESLAMVNRIVLDLLAEWLPAAVELPPDQASPASLLNDENLQHSSRSLLETERHVRRLFARGELNDRGANWTDQPANARALLGGCDTHWPVSSNWTESGIEVLQRHLNARLERRLKRVELLPAVRASYALSMVAPSLGLADADGLLYEYFKGDISRAELKRRVDNLDGVTDAVGLVRRIDQSYKEHSHKPKLSRRQMIACFAGDFMRLRRDLKYAWRALNGMDAIRLLADQREQAQALENQTLQVFCREEAVQGRLKTVVGHAIVRIDLRGTAELAAELRRRNSNPASHFSHRFFDPITYILDRYGAHKVVVEGDAMVLSVLEYASETSERFAVGRASCLALKVLEFVDAMNTENQRLDLPLIEVGLGVAYADEAPTYLYDHGRKVTISPAIKQARRLSSCHTLLRENCPLAGGRGLCVVAPVHGDHEGGDTLFRYNVYGIGLGEGAFTQLHVESSMRRLRVSNPVTRARDVLYAGHCVDVRGESQLLVVRERPIKLWMGRQLLDAHPDGIRYYEVVADAELIERVADSLAGEQPVTEPDSQLLPQEPSDHE